MKKTLQKSKNFEKKYKEIMNRYGSEKLKRRTKPRGKDVTKSINAIMKNLLKEKDNTETNRIVKTGRFCYTWMRTCVRKALLINIKALLNQKKAEKRFFSG